jgi:hypothetical protein
LQGEAGGGWKNAIQNQVKKIIISIFRKQLKVNMITLQLTYFLSLVKIKFYDKKLPSFGH